ncbi:NAD(P)-dependent iron-only hydrogenase catalytic subunit [Syntrophobotulus glycolicus DSM 8271]|uniref:NAD(P)-dependent iron-only hydrogenase catalytic subunit n=1 Tax=Syntrophobotulus glycolicus (strain DSM 8271 / FlGlyR) TaxID=645991 RepID=F0SZ65_SYNGF|nr:NADH-dependent [FeFe] hydrogenase, group A6 [Syntrophobotulus glycolicus]ADY57183.1 NAD(P)-dependent iron-only hydrogenase catalytic subunit [Syntrophobotulus glycolicus DSM 8271]
MSNVTLKIDGIEVSVPKDYTILQAARQANIEIPTLCYLQGLNEPASCRICVVEVEGWRGLQPACVTKVVEGIVVKTASKVVRETRKGILELILANHNRECLSCTRNQNCELQKMSEEMGVGEVYYQKKAARAAMDKTGPVVRDTSKCVLCGRCVSVCSSVQNVDAIDFAHRGPQTSVTTPYEEKLTARNCINCGQCIKVCPVGALSERDDTDLVWAALENSELNVVVQTAPAVRIALGEEFGLPVGTDVEGKMVTALKKLGFDKVFDTNFSADLTIMEEGTELISRINNGGKLPLITSCSPGWIKFCEHKYPDFLDNLSSCKSPQQMFGAVAKSYYPEKAGIDPKKVFVVSVMPCTAKKYEADREELVVDELKDIDVAITTRELAKMIKQAGIQFTDLADSKADSMMGEGTGAAVIFANTGGVMEAAIRTVADILTGEDLKDIDYIAVRGQEGIKEASVNIGDLELKVAVANSTGAASKLLDKIRAGESTYHFIEIMGCAGGCINGGGQPIIMDKSKTEEVKQLRTAGIYNKDKNNPKRKSHKNEEIQKLYAEYLDKPGSHKAHHILHTHYVNRGIK